jgi:aldehyde dehydrogenase (NAD+)
MGAYSIDRRSGIIFSDYKGQSCVAGSRIFVQEGIYDEFLKKFTAIAADLTSKTGDPFGKGTEHGPQVSKVQFDVCPSLMDCNFV